MPRSTIDPARAVDAYIGIGANLGDARATLAAAFNALGALPESELVQRSSIYRSAPIDSSGPDYMNAIARLRTALAAHELLAQLQSIERSHGRERPYRNAPRTLDLDLLLYGAATIASAQLQVPHPRMHERAFVLLPLAEIAPERVSEEQLREVAGQAITRLPPT